MNLSLFDDALVITTPAVVYIVNRKEQMVQYAFKIQT